MLFIYYFNLKLTGVLNSGQGFAKLYLEDIGKHLKLL